MNNLLISVGGGNSLALIGKIRKLKQEKKELIKSIKVTAQYSADPNSYVHILFAPSICIKDLGKEGIVWL